MVKAGNKETYKRAGAESSEVCDIDPCKIFPQAKIIHLQMDNIVALPYIAKMGGGGGGTHNKDLSQLAKEIWDYLLVNRIMITVEYLPGTLNVEARSVTNFSEWKLNPLIFKMIYKVSWTSDIDLFA